MSARKLANKTEKYPEHVKLKAICDKSQSCHDFLEFLFTKGYHLGKYDNISGVLTSRRPDLQKMLAEFFEIDLDKIEKEKRAMIEECVGMQNRRTHVES